MVPDLNSLFDSYSRKARLLPALLVTMPAGVFLPILAPGFDLKNLAALLAAAGVPIFIVNVVRSHGKRLENDLVAAWGGFPTTRMLRLGEPSNNPHMLSRRRKLLEEVTDVRLPEEDAERADPVDADQRYEDATRRLIARVRETNDHFALVQKENTDYGFRRNLLALKPLALAILTLLIVADLVAAVMGINWELVLTAGLIHIGCTLGWLTVVRRPWVREQADSYAQRLFETLEGPHLEPPESKAA